MRKKGDKNKEGTGVKEIKMRRKQNKNKEGRGANEGDKNEKEVE